MVKSETAFAESVFSMAVALFESDLPCAEELKRIAIICYVLAEWRVEPAVAFLNAKAVHKRWPARSETEVATLVEDTWLAAVEDDIDRVGALTSTEAPLDVVAMRTALHYVEQWRVGAWVALSGR